MNSQSKPHNPIDASTLKRTDHIEVTINPNVPLTRAQAKATYIWTGKFLNGKPLFWIPTRRVISLRSGFLHKHLCDGPTFTLGFACFFRCLFCYVYTILCRHPAIGRIRKETGLSFDQIAIEFEDPLPVLLHQLQRRDGRLNYLDNNDRRVIYASPLVDVAANLPAAQTSIKACRLILEKTHWQIRLLSKSALLKQIAAALVDYKDRVIYGLSVGTLSDKLATSFELGTSSPTARLQTLRWLQDNGYRTFGMLCPSLPQLDYDQFARQMAEVIRVDRCEHVWAEVLNGRGKAMKATQEGLRQANFIAETERLKKVARDPEAWEEYARATFLAHTEHIPAEKLRFLQYVAHEHLGWWRRQQGKGAVLLGKAAVSGPRSESNCKISL